MYAHVLMRTYMSAGKRELILGSGNRISRYTTMASESGITKLSDGTLISGTLPPDAPSNLQGKGESSGFEDLH